MDNKKSRKRIILLFVLGAILIGLAFLYSYMISPTDINNNTPIEIEIKEGTSTKQISSILKDKDLIRSKYVFLIETKLMGNKNLKAGTYSLNKSMSMNEIIDIIDGGKVNSNDVTITFKEGQRLVKYAELVDKYTDNSKEDFIGISRDTNYLKELINKYWFLTDDILKKDIYYPLEGYLYPDTYKFNKNDSVETIIEKLLDEEEQKLNKYKSTIIKKPHYYITMASIIEIEGTNLENRKMIAGIFENRLKANMNLGSDVTTYYAFNKELSESLDSYYFNTKNPYNTRASDMGGKMPIGPICNPGLVSIEASINPTKNNYYFFVADKNRKIYYTRTQEEHNRKIADLKASGDWLW